MASKRSRTERREAARRAEKLATARERLAALEEGGAADRPFTVASASLVELRALREACTACAGPLELVDHRAVHGPSGLVRALDLRCKRCERTRTAWVRVLSSTLQ